MTELSDTQMKDLVALANKRVAEAVDSVDQLVDDPEQSYLLYLAVIATMCTATADFMSEHSTMPNGEPPTPGVAYFKVLQSLAALGDSRAMRQFVKMDKEGK